MDHQALQALLESLVERWEGEVVEFKRAGNDYSSDKIGRYFSALANEANLRNQDRAWLVFGVDNRTRWWWRMEVLTTARSPSVCTT